MGSREITRDEGCLANLACLDPAEPNCRIEDCACQPMPPIVVQRNSASSAGTPEQIARTIVSDDPVSFWMYSSQPGGKRDPMRLRVQHKLTTGGMPIVRYPSPRTRKARWPCLCQCVRLMIWSNHVRNRSLDPAILCA